MVNLSVLIPVAPPLTVTYFVVSTTIVSVPVPALTINFEILVPIVSLLTSIVLPLELVSVIVLIPLVVVAKLPSVIFENVALVRLSVSTPHLLAKKPSVTVVAPDSESVSLVELPKLTATLV